MDMIDMVTAAGAFIVVVAALRHSLFEDTQRDKTRKEPEQN
jgi:hypothetical protein